MSKNKNNHNSEAIQDENNQPNPESTQSTLSQVEFDSLLVERDDWKNKALRFAADLQNTQKQNQLDIANNSKMTKKRVVQSISQFLNTFYISFNYIPEGINPEGQKFIETLKFSFNSLINDLKSLNIEVIAPNKNDFFDPTIMSPLNEYEVEQDERGFVVDNVVSIGFKIDNQVTSPATVIVKNIDK